MNRALAILSSFLLLAAACLSGCATTRRDPIDDKALYRAQDSAFRPMGN